MSSSPSDRPAPETAASRMELAISTLLRAGIIISLAIVLLGVIVMYAHHPDYLRSGQPLERLRSLDAHSPITLKDVLGNALAGSGQAMILVGVFVLFMTPVLRVVVSIFSFAWEKDWPFVLITSIVLCFLLLSLLLGKAA